MTASRPLRTIVLAGCRWELWSTDPMHTRVVFADGKTVSAVPHTSDEYRARAAALGHPDAASMARAHDLYHAWIAQLLACGSGTPYSPTLRAVAEGREAPEWLAGGEEAMVLAFDRFVNEGVPSPELAALVMAGHELDALRERAQALLHGTGEEVP